MLGESGMIAFSDELRGEFSKRGEEKLYDAIRSTYDDLLSRRLDAIALPNDNVSPADHAKFCCALCQQALLHRALYLFNAAITSLMSRNIYATTLCIRGHYEATASMGHVYRRIISLIEGNITLYEFHENLARQVLGSLEIAKAPNPINVLTMIQSADQIINKHLFEGEKKNILLDGYNFLCEFAHPDFHSYSLALQVSEDKGLMLLRQDQGSRNVEFGLIGYIDISNRLSIDLFDRFDGCVARIGV